MFESVSPTFLPTPPPSFCRSIIRQIGGGKKPPQYHKPPSYTTTRHRTVLSKKSTANRGFVTKRRQEIPIVATVKVFGGKPCFFVSPCLQQRRSRSGGCVVVGGGGRGGRRGLHYFPIYYRSELLPPPQVSSSPFSAAVSLLTRWGEEGFDKVFKLQ